MRDRRRKKGDLIISQHVLSRVAFSASAVIIDTLFICYFALSDDHQISHRDETMACALFPSRLMCLTPCEIADLDLLRFLDLVSMIEDCGLGCSLVQNRMLIVTVAISFMLRLGLIYILFTQAIFLTEALPRDDLLLLIPLSGSFFAQHEGRTRYEHALYQSETCAAVTEELS